MKNLNPTKIAKLSYLDSIRGLAAVIVVLGHSKDAFIQKKEYFSISDFFNHFFEFCFISGHFSVCIFFVLSGFVLSLGFFNNYDYNFILKQSIKRFPRLFLPVIFTSVLYWFAKEQSWFFNSEVVNITHSTWFVKFWKESYTIKQLILRCGYDLFLFNDHGFLKNINFCLWTMPIELKYSFLLFLVICFIRNSFMAIVVNTILIFTLVMYADTLFIYFLGFLLGINISFLYTNKIFNLNSFGRSALLVFGLLLGCNLDLIFNFKVQYLTVSTFTITLNLIGASMIIIAILSSKKMQNILNNKILLYLGKISFSLYLIHPLVIGTIVSRLYLYLNNSFSYDFTYITVMIISLILSLLLGDIIYRFIDKPSIKFAEIIYKIFNTFRKKIFKS